MRNIINLLFLIPILGVTQGPIDCSSLSVNELVIDDENFNIEITIHNGDTISPQYTYLSQIIDNKGDSVQLGRRMDHFAHIRNNTEVYHYHLSEKILISYPIKIHFEYTDFQAKGIKRTCILNFK